MASTFELALPVWQVLQGAPSVSMATGRQLEPANNERLCRCRTPFPASPSGLSFGLITAYQETRVLDPNQNRPQSVSVGLIGVPRNVLASLSNTWHLGRGELRRLHPSSGNRRCFSDRHFSPTPSIDFVPTLGSVSKVCRATQQRLISRRKRNPDGRRYRSPPTCGEYGDNRCKPGFHRGPCVVARADSGWPRWFCRRVSLDRHDSRCISRPPAPDRVAVHRGTARR